jgi:hypothetical protein
MMEHLIILAQAARSASEPLIRMQSVLDSMWEQITTLSWLQAIIAISFGVVYLLYGWRIFKVLVFICFGLVGLFVGIRIGAQYDLEILGGIAGLSILGGISIPLMRWAVSILGAIAGGILTGGIWYAVGLPERYMAAGALIGIVAGGMISFIVFRIAVMLFTSLGGGTLIVIGLLTLLHQYESIQRPPTDTVKTMLYHHHWFLPVLLIAVTFIGILLQNRFIKSSKSWNV